jgi:hypothetical protein
MHGKSTQVVVMYFVWLIISLNFEAWDMLVRVIDGRRNRDCTLSRFSLYVVLRGFSTTRKVLQRSQLTVLGAE